MIYRHLDHEVLTAAVSHHLVAICQGNVLDRQCDISHVWDVAATEPTHVTEAAQRSFAGHAIAVAMGGHEPDCGGDNCMGRISTDLWQRVYWPALRDVCREYETPGDASAHIDKSDPYAWVAAVVRDPRTKWEWLLAARPMSTSDVYAALERHCDDLHAELDDLQSRIEDVEELQRRLDDGESDLEPEVRAELLSQGTSLDALMAEVAS